MEVTPATQLRKLLFILFAIAFIYSGGNLLYIWWDYRQGAEIYEEVREENFHIPEPPPAEPNPPAEKPFSLAEVDLDALRQTNPEVFGWIWIPDTAICYPLVQGSDNEKYLNLTYNLRHSATGSIFMDYRNSTDLSGDHTIIYGHNMKNGTMFGNLRAFGNAAYLNAHEFVYLFVEAGVYKYQIFSAHSTDAANSIYSTNFSAGFSFADFVASLPGVVKKPPAGEPPLVTLSTCIAGREKERFVVHAALVEFLEAD